MTISMLRFSMRNARAYSSMVDRVKVQVPQGSLLGVVDQFRNGEPFYAFKGIPYAVPPVGELRFKDPIPLKKFAEGEIDCSTEGNPSIHKDPYRAKLVGSEDCLYLNVYSPIRPSEVQKPLPVMVWIHGGAFQMDSGSENLYSPEYLIDKGVIVVTLNYRLGPLGFLHFPRMGIKGNMGLKDQLLALKWVNENIQQFGGDKNNICLFGESAGSASTHLHLLSTESRPYFQKAILQSGVALNDWVMQQFAEEKAKKLANFSNKTDKPLESDEEIYHCLMTADPVKLCMDATKTLTEEEKKRGLPITFKPVVEERGPGAILTEEPLETLNKLKVNYKPLMLGYTSNEGIIMLLDAVKNKKLEEYNQEFYRLIPVDLCNDPEAPEMKEIVKQVRNFYFDGKPVSKETVGQLGTLFGEFYFILGVHWVAEIMARLEQLSPLYMYQFSYDGELNLPKKLFGLGKHKGACHGDDMFYLFKMKFVDMDVEEDAEAYKVRDNMCRMWTNFAKSSNPTPAGDPHLAGVEWKPIPQQKGEFKPIALDINTKLEMIAPNVDRINFWKKLYNTYNKNFLSSKL